MDQSSKSTSFFWDLAQFEGESCIIAGFFKNSNKIGKNDVFSHRFWFLAMKFLKKEPAPGY